MKYVLNTIGKFIREAIKLVCDLIMLALFAAIIALVCVGVAIVGIVYAIYYKEAPSETIHRLFTGLWEMLTENIENL